MAGRQLTVVPQRADLQDQVDELLSALGQKEDKLWRLQAAPAHKTILGLLLARERIKRESIWICLYSHLPEADRPTDDKIVDVHLCHVRKWLRDRDIELRHVSGEEGCWYIDRDGKARLRRMIDGELEEQMLDEQSGGLSATQRAAILQMTGGEKGKFASLGIAHRESRVLAAMLIYEVATTKMLRDAAFLDKTPPSSWETILGTYRGNVQRAIKGTATIQNKRGEGWFLSDSDKVAVSRLIEREEREVYTPPLKVQGGYQPEPGPRPAPPTTGSGVKPPPGGIVVRHEIREIEPEDDEHDFKLEDGIPIPPPRQPKHKYNLWRMKVGQSFLIRCDKKDTKKVRINLYKVFQLFKQREPNWKFEQRDMYLHGEKGVRVWLIK